MSIINKQKKVDNQLKWAYYSDKKKPSYWPKYIFLKRLKMINMLYDHCNIYYNWQSIFKRKYQFRLNVIFWFGQQLNTHVYINKRFKLYFLTPLFVLPLQKCAAWIYQCWAVYRQLISQVISFVIINLFCTLKFEYKEDV